MMKRDFKTKSIELEDMMRNMRQSVIVTIQ